MATRNIVPRANNEGGVGTTSKKWANIWSTLINALTLTTQSVGFTISGGTTSKTLTVSDDATVSGTNTGDQTGGTPALTLGTTNTAGTSANFIRRDDTVLAFDATDPSTQALGDAAVVGVASVAARRDHKHAMPAAAIADLVNDTTPQLGGVLDINEKSIEQEFGTLTSDHTASGNIITATAGEALAFGDVCYFKSDGKFWKSDADAAATSIGMLTMAIATISANAAGLFLKKGFARDDTWAWTAGAELWLDTTTAGGMTATKPSGTLDIVRLAGWAKAADYVEFNPSSMYLEIA